MSPEQKTEAERLEEIYEGLKTGEGSALQDLYPLLVDMVRRIEALEANARVMKPINLNE